MAWLRMPGIITRHARHIPAMPELDRSLRKHKRVAATHQRRHRPARRPGAIKLEKFETYLKLANRPAPSVRGSSRPARVHRAAGRSWSPPSHVQGRGARVHRAAGWVRTPASIACFLSLSLSLSRASTPSRSLSHVRHMHACMDSYYYVTSSLLLQYSSKY
jgi:hypothetical protein